MSFNINDSSRFAKDKSVICNYYDCSIYFNQYERTPNNGRCIKIPFFTPENTVRPNALFISDKPTVKYMSSSLHIYKKTHDIGGIDYDGELVIENKQITNGDSKMFICFPLKTANMKPNIIDKIISKSEQLNSNELKMTVNLNPMFNKLQKYIFYKSGNDIVVVFTEPINVNSMFNKFVECNLFSKYNDKYSILQNVSGKEGFTEGFVEGIDSGEMDCEPIDITTNQPFTDLPTLVGVTSGSSSQNKTINLLFTMILFVIIFCVAFFGSPAFYKQIFIDKLEDTDLTYTTIFCIFYLLWCIGMLVGMIWDTGAGIAGVTFLILFGMSGLTIVGRTYYDEYYFPGVENGFDFKKFYDDSTTPGTGIIPFFFSHMLDFLSVFITSLRNNKKYWIYKYGHIFVIISIILTSCLMFYIHQFNDPVNKRDNRKNKLGKKVSDKTRQKYKDYMIYANTMLSIFGFGYGILVVGPFIGYITT